MAKVTGKILTQYEVLRNEVDHYHREILQQDELKDSMDSTKDKLSSVGGERVQISEKELGEQTRLSNQIIAGMILFALLYGIFQTCILVKRIVGKIDVVIGGITEGAEQGTSASQQVAGSSQNLAEGTSQQAASIEETSSSMANRTRNTPEKPRV